MTPVQRLNSLHLHLTDYHVSGQNATSKPDTHYRKQLTISAVAASLLSLHWDVSCLMYRAACAS